MDFAGLLCLFANVQAISNQNLFFLSNCESGDQEDMVPLWSLWELVSFGKALKQIGTKRTAKIPHAAELCATWTYLDIDVEDEHG